MKKAILLFSLLYIVVSLSAQQVSGRIVGLDSLSVPGVAVVMQTMDSVYVNAGVSDVEGYFRIESSVRPYRLLIQHVAYKPLSIESSHSNVGTVFLEEMVNELSGITVKGERPIMKVDNGKLSYDLKAITQNKIIDNTFDLIKELPSISSGGNSLNIIGEMGGTDILISGKKSNMSIDQLLEYLRTLPANQVEKIEVVYNPPPSWHVKGSAINIVLKKENKYALQGQVQGRYTNKYANSYMLGGSVFLSSPHVSFDLIYNINDNRSKSLNLQESLHAVKNETYDIQTDMLTKTHRQYHNLYSSLKYDFDQKNNLELSYVGQFAPKSNTNNVSLTNYFSDAYSEDNKNDYLHDIGLTYTSSFGLKTGVEYTHFRNDGLQTLQYLNETDATDALAYNLGQRIHRANVFADMEHSLSQGWQLSYGAKYDYTENTNTQVYDDKEHNGEGSYSHSSVTKEHVTNMHIDLSKSFFDGKLNASASVEGELYKINDYKKNTLLPNVSVGYTLNSKNFFQLAYRTFRIYPSYWERQEYTTYEDEYNVSVGNPTLRPSKFSFVNLMYLLRNKYMFQIIYQRVNDDFITQDYQSSDALQKIRKTSNVDLYSNFILVAVIPIKVGEVWSINLSANAFNQRYKTDNWFDLSYDRHKWTGLISANNTVTLLKKPMITLNAFLFYNSPTIQGIWDLGSLWGANAGIKWEIVKGRAILNFQCKDIFNSQYPIIKARYGNQHLDMDYTSYQRSFMVSFSYSFKGYKEKRTKSVDTSRYGL